MQINVRNIDTRLVAFITSLLMSLLWLSYGEPINVDGILYLQLAHIYLNHGLSAMLKSFQWPFYPLLIAWVSKLTSLSLYHSAQLLNAFLIALSLSAFVSIFRNLKASATIQWIALALLLFYPALAHERTNLYRDFGYYAFMLCGFNQLIKFAMQQKAHQIVTWFFCTLIAGLFRMEGIVFLLCVPWFFWIWKGASLKQKSSYFLIAISPLIILSLVLLGLAISQSQLSLMLYKFMTIGYQNFANHIGNFYQQVNQHIQALQQNVLTIISKRNAMGMLFGGVVTLFIIALIKAFNWVYIILLGFGFSDFKKQCSNNILRIYYGYIFINIMVLFGFLFQQLFLTTRYMMFLAMLLMLPVPFGIIRLIKMIPSRRYVAPALLICALYFTVSSLFHIGASKAYYITAGEWVQQHTPKTAQFYSNSPRLVYYMQRPGKKHFRYGIGINVDTIIPSVHSKKYDYLAIQVNKSQVPLINAQIKEASVKTVKTFQNNRHDKIFIIKIHQKR